MAKVVAVDFIPASSFRTSTAYAFLLAATLLLGFGLRLHFFDSNIARSPDEATYARQEQVLRAQGTAGFHFMGTEFDQNPVVMARQPSPARIGYLGLLALYMQVSGDTSDLAGAQLSLLCSLAALGLIAFIAYRALSPLIALMATLFYAVLPFDLVTSRRAWQDSVIACVALAIFGLAVAVARASPRRRTVLCIAFALFGVFAIATKENLAIFFLFCAAGLILHFLIQKDRSAALLTSACVALAGITAFAVLASLFGGPAHYLNLVRGYAHLSGNGAYDQQFNSGPFWMFAVGFFRASPVLCLAAVIGLGVPMARLFRSRNLRNFDIATAIAILTCCMLLLQVVTTRYNYRYSAPIYGTLCLLGGIGMETVLMSLAKLLAPLGRSVAWAILGFAVAVAGLRDFNFARDVLLPTGIQDLALRTVAGFPPAPLPPSDAR